MNRMHLKTLVALTVLLLGLPLAAIAQESTPPPGENGSSEGSLERVAFQDQMRKLWEDHITWTRLYIVSFAV